MGELRELENRNLLEQESEFLRRIAAISVGAGNSPNVRRGEKRHASSGDL
ncbi:hypothetical protein [Rhodococcus globerulus]|uniref:Transposase n=1 Tax=Rhodococcus globerulus TaxID=33008 RepID=A0ABU4C5M5_RHOGO|nr:hypothetical protein [Rhodococcus globerulus]MDV6271569.1 hypothetical protein [Rhodococcus globerulus]